ncbi:hypothetical protein ACWDYH_00595 [Nocardia goodfellowii]
MSSVALVPGALPPPAKLNPTKGSDGIWRLDRVRHRAFNGEYPRTSAQGATRKECLEEWMRRFDENNRKGSNRQRRSKRRQFQPTDRMSEVFAELDAQYAARRDKGEISPDSYNNVHRTIYKPSVLPQRSPNPNAFKLETEFGHLSIMEAADAADITDYLDEVTETAWSTALFHHLILSQAFRLAVTGRGIEAQANPMPHVPVPTAKRAEPRPLSAAAQIGVLRRIETWLNDERGESGYLPLYYLTLLGTGARPGEGLAIRWCDLTKEDFDGIAKSVLYIGATVSIKDGVTYRREGRKAGNSYRVVLPNWLADELWAEKARVRPASEELPIFRGPRTGTWISPHCAGMSVQTLRAGGEFPDFKLSDLRDTVATHVAVVTDDDDRASAQLGHSNGKKSMAQRHYIHQGERRMVAVDNSEVLELLNPFKTGAKLESAA